MINLKSALILFLLAAAIVCPLAAEASGGKSNWAQWRGPESQGISAEKGLPVEWSETKNIKWKAALPGRGHSSPIIWGKKIFLTTAIEGPVIEGAEPAKHYYGGQLYIHPDSVGGTRQQTMKLLCLDADSGKIIWERTAYEGRVYDDRHRKASYASSTPVTDGRYVYTYFGSEGVYCYDFNGALVWKASLGNISTLGMGIGTSPVLYENLLILQCDEDHGDKSFIIALDKKTGKQVWKTSRKIEMSWTTPVIVRGGGRVELVASGNENIVSYDPATGKELWRCKGLESYTIATPVVGHGLVIVSAGYPVKRALAIRLGGSGDLTGTSQIAWKHEKGTAYVPSPILYGDYVYLTTDRGILTCLDAKTGEIKYEGARPPVPATFTASPVAFEDKILMTSEDGDTFVIKAGPKHEILRTNSVGEPVYSSPAIAGGRIFIRGEKHLFCIANR